MISNLQIEFLKEEADDRTQPARKKSEDKTSVADNSAEKKYLRVEEVAQLLLVNRSTIFVWIKKGLLAPIRIGGVIRFDPSDVSRFIKEGKLRESRRKTKRILLIDDDHLIRDSLSKVLKQANYEVVTAEDGEAALQKIKETSFDLIISDIRMPKMNGLETIRAIRRTKKNLGQPRSGEMLITAFHEGDPEVQATELGVDDCLFKPFSIEELLRAVRQNIRRREAIEG